MFQADERASGIPDCEWLLGTSLHEHRKMCAGASRKATGKGIEDGTFRRTGIASYQRFLAKPSRAIEFPKGLVIMDENRVLNVLFLCTHNSARSIMGEAILKNIAVSRGRFRAFSAGSHPATQPHPFALDQIRRAGLPVEGLRSKNWDEFAAPGSPRLDFVFTVCDNAAKEICPVWPGQPMTAHWGLPDPSHVEGTDEERRRAFSETFRFLANRINIFVSLPIDKLDRLSLQNRLDEIGKKK